uniref:(northern house mosquito) hypothetical protein n=1 Tax=Culex pipiens TaxID=7175 RepID=A0A8D8IT12_CULPI
MQLPLPNPAAAALAKRGRKKNSRNGGCFSNFLDVAAPEFVMTIKVNAGTEEQIGVTVEIAEVIDEMTGGLCERRRTVVVPVPLNRRSHLGQHQQQARRRGQEKKPDSFSTRK